MAIKVTEKIQISGSESLIASYMFNPEKDPAWISGIQEIKSVSHSPIEEGAEIHRLAHFLGKDIDYILKVTKLEKDRLLSMDSIKGPFPMKVNYNITPSNISLEEGSPSCLVSIDITGKSKGYFMFVDRLLSLMVSQNIKGDLQKLKQIIEGDTNEYLRD